jgi:hypothetical protein
MLIVGLFISVLLLILNEAGFLVLSSFYIWLPLYCGIGIFIVNLIAAIYVAILLNNGKINNKESKWR